MDEQEAKRILEGVLFVSGQPVSLKRLKEIAGELEPKTVRALIDQLNQEYAQGQRAFRVQEVADGFQLVTEASLAPWIKRALSLPKEDVVSKAAMETLAIIAYKQPVTKAEIELIRGVDVTGTLDTLLERQFVRVAGRKDTPGRPLLYGTTTEFLRHFGLKDVKELPAMTQETAVPTLPLVRPASTDAPVPEPAAQQTAHDSSTTSTTN